MIDLDEIFKCAEAPLAYWDHDQLTAKILAIADELEAARRVIEFAQLVAGVPRVEHEFTTERWKALREALAEYRRVTEGEASAP